MMTLDLSEEVKVNFINYFFRGICACIITGIFAIIAYVGTIFAMLFWNWKLEFESLQVIHKDVGKMWMDFTFKR